MAFSRFEQTEGEFRMARQRFLFFQRGAQAVNFRTAAQRMTLNTEFYARRRADVLARLEADAPQYIADLRLGSR